MLSALAAHALECVRQKLKRFEEALNAEVAALSPARRLTLPVAATHVRGGGGRPPDLKVLAKQKQQRRAAQKKR